MTRSTAPASLLAIALAAVALAGCASTAAIDVAPPSIARADEPDARLGADRAPSEPRPFEGPGADAARAALSPPTSTALNDRELARIDALLACAIDRRRSCVAEPHPLAIDDAAARALLATNARDPRMRRAASTVARAVIEEALAPTARERAARRRALTFLDERAVFALDDVPTLLLQSKRDDRRRVLAAARPALERSVDIAAEERAIVEAAAVRFGVTRAQLLARRAGIDEASLRALVDGVLAGTAPLLTAVASDVTLLPDVRGPVSDGKAARAAATHARQHADPMLVEAIARASSAPRNQDDTRDWTRALAVDARIAALSVRALLDAADADARDKLASRILLDDEADVVPGAGVLLSVDASGAVVERFAALLSTPALARMLRDGARPADWIRAWAEAPPLEERGHPEAFIEVLKVLPELASE